MLGKHHVIILAAGKGERMRSNELKQFLILGMRILFLRIMIRILTFLLQLLFSKMIISLIAAIDKNGVIGADGDLPWNIPSDLKKFKEITSYKPIIMGRKTWDSIGRPLPNRDNIVISRNKNLNLEGAILTSSPEEAITIAKQRAKENGADEIMIIGGGYIYNEFICVSTHVCFFQIVSSCFM